MKRLDGPDARYWQELEAGKLVLPRCAGCEQWIWPAAHRCPSCKSEEVTWQERPMHGTVFSWTRSWHRFGLSESIDLPYTSVLIEIDDCGIRLLGLLDDPDQIDPSIGDAVSGRPSTTKVLDDDIPTITWNRS